MNTDKHYLYVFKIDFLHVLHYSCFDYDERDFAILEASLLYDYIDFTKAVIKDFFDDYSLYDIDPNVKLFMSNYGIENVRGGSYKSKELPDYVKKSLETELKSTEHIDERQDIICNIIFEHKNDNDSDKIINCYNTICDSVKKYEYAKQMYNYIRNIEYEDILDKINKKYFFNYEFVDNINFIEKLYYSDKQLPLANNEDYQFYIKTISILKELPKYFYIVHNKYYNNDYVIDPSKTVYIKHPEFLMSNRKNEAATQDIEIIKNNHKLFNETIELFRFMFFFLLNRMEEFEFDMNMYSNGNPEKMYLQKKYYEKMLDM